MAHAENIGAKYDSDGCDVAKGHWVGKICLRLFYRNPNIASIYSNSININENGSYQTFNFSTFKDSSDNPISNIPMGLNAIGIYEYDGSSCKTSTTLYPNDRKPISVQFIPHTTLPIINW